MAQENRWKKPLMIAFLIMVVLGFSVPLFNLGGNGNTPPQNSPPRLCQSDADCYLTCGQIALTILCSQNLCVQNSCDELGLFPYLQPSKYLALEVVINGTGIPLENKNAADLFVRFSNGIVEGHGALPLSAIVEKAGVLLQDQCITISGKQYCSSADAKLNITVNGQNTYLFGQYVPQESDEIMIAYLSVRS